VKLERAPRTLPEMWLLDMILVILVTTSATLVGISIPAIPVTIRFVQCAVCTPSVNSVLVGPNLSPMQPVVNAWTTTTTTPFTRRVVSLLVSNVTRPASVLRAGLGTLGKTARSPVMVTELEIGSDALALLDSPASTVKCRVMTHV